MPNPSVAELARLASDCLEIAGRGAAVAAAGFGSRPRIDQKAPHDLVTEFDVASQELILELIAARHPGVAVVAEEGGSPTDRALAADVTFVVDPIDGTTNFAHGHPVWSVSVGVLCNGRPAAGAVVAPSLSLAWHGFVSSSGGGCYRNGAPRSVSATAKLDHALLATGFPPVRDRAPDDNFASFISVKRRAGAVRRCGSAAIDLCFVADGTYDGYWERRLHIWDSAAGAALIAAAGGTITALDGSPPILERGHIAASNGKIHDELVAAIAG